MIDWKIIADECSIDSTLLVGTADSALLELLIDKGCSVAKIDSEQREPNMAAQRFANVLLIGSLEQTKDPKELLQWARTRIKPDGKLIVVVPNFGHGDSILAILSGAIKYEPKSLVAPDLHGFTAVSLRDLIHASGLSVVLRGCAPAALGTTPEIDFDQIPSELAFFVEALPFAEHSHLIAVALPQKFNEADQTVADESALQSAWTETIGGFLEQQRANISRQEKYIADLERQVHEQTNFANSLLNSHGWRLVTRLSDMRERILPKDSKRRAVAEFVLNRSFGDRRSASLKDLMRRLTGKGVMPGEPDEKLRAFLAVRGARLAFPQFPKPKVSILIPSYNRAGYLFECLASILAYTGEKIPYEVIVVDDASQDSTQTLLSRCDNVTVIRNGQNLEYLKSCNKGAQQADGEYLLLLNNDVSVQTGWLEHLVRTMETYPDCGAVGAKLVRFDGSLQEAGCMVWADGTAHGYGRDGDPTSPEYCYVREVDYCSAACLVIRNGLFKELGGFDDQYAPAYYEDTDLCFSIAQAGFKVVYQPLCEVLHREFGSRPAARSQELMLENQKKFRTKFAHVLSERQGNNVLRARDSRTGRRILFVDDMIPDPAFGAGFTRAYQMVTGLQRLGDVVTFLPSRDRNGYQPITNDLQQLGIEVLFGGALSPTQTLIERAHLYDIVIVSRPNNAPVFLNLAQRYQSEALLVYDAEALFAVREILQAEIENRPLTEVQKRFLVNEELQHMRAADVVVTVSDQERDLVLSQRAHKDVRVWGHAIQPHKPRNSFDNREGLLFVGAGNGPNVDGIQYFARKVFPLVLERIPNCKLHIVGTRLPNEVTALKSENIEVLGFVRELDEIYERARVFIAPLRFGAGISAKVIEAMGHGVPTVVSKLAAKGLDVRNEYELCVAEDHEEFARLIVRCYTDRRLWSQIQQCGLNFVEEHFSPQHMQERLAQIIGKHKRGPATLRRWKPAVDAEFGEALDVAAIRNVSFISSSRD